MTAKKKIYISHISTLHIIKLIFRSCLLIATAILYVVNRIRQSGNLILDEEHKPWILAFIWVIFVVEMFFRFFPSRLESMGCQKQFRRNYRPTTKKQVNTTKTSSIVWVAIFWIVLNGIIGILYFQHLIDDAILLLISLAYSVCDMICILFFCPFQTWFMKNKCCTSCRIYNWDYAMMFTPLIFTKDIFALSLFAFAILLLARWELTAYLYPERFSEATNESLSCAQCKEKLCHHKTQLQSFHKKLRLLHRKEQ